MESNSEKDNKNYIVEGEIQEKESCEEDCKEEKQEKDDDKEE